MLRKPLRLRPLAKLPFAATAVLLLASSTHARAQDKQSDTLWRTYFNAAAVEIESSQDASDSSVKKAREQNAVVLLQSALDVANRIDPNGPRPRMSSWLLNLTYNRLGESETGQKIMDASKPVDLKDFPPSLLPVTATLDKLANTYLEHSKDEAYDPFLELFDAFNCMKWEVAILGNTFPGDPQLAKPTALFGLTEMRLGFKFYDTANNQPKDKEADRDSDRKSAEAYMQMAIDSYVKAIDLWEKNRQAEATLAANSQRYMVSQDRASTSASGNTSSSAGASETQDPNSVNILISNTYQKLGDLYSDMKQEDKAREQYKKAEAPLTLVFTGVEAKWPNHVEGAFDRNMLGVLYVKENRYSDAEQQFRIALKTFESSQGKTGENTKTLAENLAYALKLQHRDADAQAVAQQYSVKAD